MSSNSHLLQTLSDIEDAANEQNVPATTLHLLRENIFLPPSEAMEISVLRTFLRSLAVRIRAEQTQQINRLANNYYRTRRLARAIDTLFLDELKAIFRKRWR